MKTHQERQHINHSEVTPIKPFYNEDANTINLNEGGSIAEISEAASEY